MKKSSVFLALILLIKLAAAQQFIAVKGKEIVDASGKPFLIRGTNLGNWLLAEGYMFKFESTSSARLINEAFTEVMGPSQTRQFWAKFMQNYIREDDIRYLKHTGINTLRVPFSYQLFYPEDYMGSSDATRGLRVLDSLTSWCRRAGIYMILDLHAAPGGQTGANIDNGYAYPFLYEDQASRRQTVDLWQKIARHFKNEPTILGYDLLNEPIAPAFKKFNTMLMPLYREITAAIRTVDTSHIVFYGGAQWDSDFDEITPPFDKKSALTFHLYWAPVSQKLLTKFIALRDKFNVPLYCGETGENKDAWIHDFKVLLEKNNIGWTYWCYKKMFNDSGFISYPKPEGYDSIIAYTAKNRSTFELVTAAAPHNRAAATASIMQITTNCLLENSTINTGYLKALDLDTTALPGTGRGLSGLVASGTFPHSVASQFSFTEGPACDSKGNVYFTDQPNDKIWEYSGAGQLSLYMEHADRANGMHMDHKDNLIVCADLKNQVWKISPQKKVTILVKDYDGQLLNGPNDVWVTRKGDLYLTDPLYTRSYWNRNQAPIANHAVYYLKAGSQKLVRAAEGFSQPNGITGTADGKYLYVSDIDAKKTFKYSIATNGSLQDKQLLFSAGSDGMTLDEKGNIYTTGDGVTVFDPQGKKLGHIAIPENWTSNVCFSGRDKKTLFITATKSVYTLPMLVRGAE